MPASALPEFANLIVAAAGLVSGWAALSPPKAASDLIDAQERELRALKAAAPPGVDLAQVDSCLTAAVGDRKFNTLFSRAAILGAPAAFAYQALFLVSPGDPSAPLLFTAEFLAASAAAAGALLGHAHRFTTNTLAESLDKWGKSDPRGAVPLIGALMRARDGARARAEALEIAASSTAPAHDAPRRARL